MSLSEYLSKNYLGVSGKKKDKKKSSQKRENSLIIDDQPVHATRTKRVKTSSGPDAEIKAPSNSTDVKSTGEKGWKLVGTNETVEIPKAHTNDVAPQMSSGAKAGLQTASQVAEQIREKEEEEKKQLSSLQKNNETVYRDKSGRRVDIHKIRERERLKNKQIELEKERKKRELNMGLVQKLQIEKSRNDLEKAKNSSLSRYADDKEMNDVLKGKEIDDDPLLSFKPSKSKKYVSLTGRKLYREGFPENRFGISPGWRWDGVDRSNGFENKWFKKQVEREREKTLSYTMQEEY